LCYLFFVWQVISLYDLIDPQPGPFEEIYIVMDYMDTNMQKVIYSSNKLTDEHIQYFTYQILRSLKFIHSAHVIHRDLKPSNLLVKSNCDLKICDFGLARGIKDDVDNKLTEYVVTRWYRAPEILLSCKEYDAKVDVFSLGCILAEILGRKPLFPGENDSKQLQLLLDYLGTPTGEDINFISNVHALEYIQGLDPKEKKPLSKLFPNANPLLLSLIDRMLCFNPYKRISVDEALAHPYLKRLRDVNSEIVCKEPFDFEFEKADLTKPVLQELMWREIMNIRPGTREKGEKWIKELKGSLAEKDKASGQVPMSPAVTN